MRLPYTLVLASASPRRSSLLSQANLPFTVVVSSFDEAEIRPQKQSLGAAAYVELSAQYKARAVASESGVEGPMVVLGCDTVVASPGGSILEKPTSKAEAAEVRLVLSSVESKSLMILLALLLASLVAPSIPQWYNPQGAHWRVNDNIMGGGGDLEPGH